jgi:transposase-like protein
MADGGGMNHRNTSKDRKWSELLRRHWSQADARVVLETWRGSGLTMSAFARQHGIGLSRLSGWKQRVGDVSSRRSGTKKTADANAGDLAFAKVIVTGASKQGAPAATVRVGIVELEIHDPERVDGAWVSKMVSALGVNS